MSKKLAIFGCGYLGSEIARQAQDKGWLVVALTHNEDVASSLRSLGLSQVVVDELDGGSWHDAIDANQDYVVNCVGSSSHDVQGYVKSYVEGQESIMKWSEKGSVGTFVYTSSSSVYPQTGRRLVDETASSDGVSELGGLLLAAEQFGFPGGDLIGRSFVLRLGGLYGPGRHLLLDSVRKGEELSGNGDRVLNLIHRDDAVSAVFAVLGSPESNVGRIYNVTDGHHASRAEIVDWLSTKLGVETPSFAEDDSEDHPNRKVSNDRIRDELDWTPSFPSFRSGYESFLD